jgi:hypothetical protein
MSRKSVFSKGDFSKEPENDRVADPANEWDRHFGAEPEDAKTQYQSRELVRRDKRQQRLANLSQRQKKLEELSPDEESRLLVAAQAGDDSATRTLVLHHLSTIQVYARQKWRRHNPAQNQYDEQAITVEDFIDAAIEGFLRAIHAFRPGSNNRLNALSRRFIDGALSDIARDWRNCGIQAESRLQRIIRGHPFSSAEWVQAEYCRKYPNSKAPSLDKIAAEMDAAFTLWQPGNSKYDETSVFTDAGDHHQGGDRDGDFMGGPSAFNGPVRGYEGGAVSEGSRSWATNSLHPIRKNEHPSDWVAPTPENRGGSIFAERMMAERDARVAAEINKIGRREYANALVQREQPKISETRSAPSLKATAPFNPVEVRHAQPLPGPRQAEDSLWNHVGVSRYKDSLNSITENFPTKSFDDALAASIGAIEIPSNDDTKQDLAA